LYPKRKRIGIIGPPATFKHLMTYSVPFPYLVPHLLS